MTADMGLHNEAIVAGRREVRSPLVAVAPRPFRLMRPEARLAPRFDDLVQPLLDTELTHSER